MHLVVYYIRSTTTSIGLFIMIRSEKLQHGWYEKRTSRKFKPLRCIFNRLSFLSLVDNMKSEAPNCLKCKYYYVTYKKDKPFGCRAMGFISRTSPSRVVYASSGMHCQKFTSKKQKL